MDKSKDQVKMEREGKYFKGTGRRKTAIASVRIYEKGGKGDFKVNSKTVEAYFPTKELQEIVVAPLDTVGEKKGLDVTVLVKGGGLRGQAEAIRLGLSRSLVRFKEDFKKSLKDQGYLTRDDRRVERKKPGLKKARRAGQFSKR